MAASAQRSPHPPAHPERQKRRAFLVSIFTRGLGSSLSWQNYRSSSENGAQKRGVCLTASKASESAGLFCRRNLSSALRRWQQENSPPSPLVSSFCCCRRLPSSTSMLATASSVLSFMYYEQADRRTDTQTDGRTQHHHQQASALAAAAVADVARQQYAWHLALSVSWFYYAL